MLPRKVEMPTVAGQPEGTVLIKSLYASICGSDMLYFHKLREIDQ